MPETEVETPAPPANETVKEEAVKADADNATEEKKDEEKPSEETKTKEAEAKEPKPKKEKKPKEPAPPPPPAVHKKDFEKEVVYVYQFNRTATVPSISPACLKLETWLKLNGIKFETVNHSSKLRSKRGLLPFVELNGEEICDSDYIIKQLAAKFEKEDPAANLTPEQKNVQHAMVTMVENHLQWAIMHWRVKNADNTLKGFHLDLQGMMGTKMPVALLNFVFKHTMLRKGMKKVKAAGFNGYTPEEIEQFGKDDLKVLSELLGDKQFFFGDDPNHLDLVAFSQIALVLNVDDSENGAKCPLKEFINADCTNLVGLVTRMKDRAWGDHWDEAIGEKMELNPHIPKPDPPKEEEKEEKKEEAVEEKKEAADDKKEEDKEKADSDEKEKEEEKKEESK
jgi:glutathione S-transferase